MISYKQAGIIEHFTENMRKMSHLEQRELQCSEIELSELAKKIEAEAAMLSKKESKLCKVESVQEQNIVKVDEELVMEVTDNLLENAVRYAQKSIALQIKKKDGFLIISVEDDGIGFDTNKKNKGIGIQTIAQRIQSINGTFSLISRPNEGTKIRVDIRLKNRHKS